MFSNHILINKQRIKRMPFSDIQGSARHRIESWPVMNTTNNKDSYVKVRNHLFLLWKRIEDAQGKRSPFQRDWVLWNKELSDSACWVIWMKGYYRRRFDRGYEREDLLRCEERTLQLLCPFFSRPRLGLQLILILRASGRLEHLFKRYSLLGGKGTTECTATCL